MYAENPPWLDLENNAFASMFGKETTITTITKVSRRKEFHPSKELPMQIRLAPDALEIGASVQCGSRSFDALSLYLEVSC
jgi:hypothetical protein